MKKLVLAGALVLSILGAGSVFAQNANSTTTNDNMSMGRHHGRHHRRHHRRGHHRRGRRGGNTNT